MTRVPVSIVCVFNDPDVLAGCLARSVAAGRADAPEVELVAVDNRRGDHPGAGAALNEGARRARNPVVAFAHQDVFLHSLVALERAAGALLARPDIALLGAVGVTGAGRVTGLVRDRVALIGAPAGPLTPVDSVDEVLFLVRRQEVLADPLSEDPALGWHAYAVEYGARARAGGRRVAAADLAITHNSMTTNLDGLAAAHARVAELHPGTTPLRTTCGVVRRERAAMAGAVARRAGRLATWGLEWWAGRRVARLAGTSSSDVAVGDIRFTVDDALDLVGAHRLDVVNVAAAPGWGVEGLRRRGREVTARTVPAHELTGAVGRPGPGRALLVTGPVGPWISAVAGALPDRVVGLSREGGAWVLAADAVHGARGLWPSWRSRSAAGLRGPARAARAGAAP